MIIINMINSVAKREPYLYLSKKLSENTALLTNYTRIYATNCQRLKHIF